MKPVLTSGRTVAQAQESIQSRIVLLNEKGFLWREIAELAGLPKKLIKALAKGEIELGEGLCDTVSQALDDAISRLKDCMHDACPEQYLDAEDYEYIKLEVASVTLYKKRADDKMIVQIHGVKVHE
jgi:hypothetical protein